MQNQTAHEAVRLLCRGIGLAINVMTLGVYDDHDPCRHLKAKAVDGEDVDTAVLLPQLLGLLLFVSSCLSAFLMYCACVMLIGAELLGFTEQWWKCGPSLDDEALVEDLWRARKAFEGVGGLLTGQAGYDKEDVVEYYRETTDRDYQFLESLQGPGMHTRLSHVTQEMIVLNEIATTRRSLREPMNVLEVGCGRGCCTLFLAGALPGVKFTGVDLVERHVEVAKRECEARGLQGNATFAVGDAAEGVDGLGLGRFHLIFGVESLCHMDTKEKVEEFARQAERMLAPGGKLVIVDGFRCRNWKMASADQQAAMRLAESGFKIRAMPSKADWIFAGHEHGLIFSKSSDLTEEALPFWRLGWRAARAVLRYPMMVRFFARSSPARTQSAGNLLAAAMVAHALRSGAAEYGVLVLEKCRRRGEVPAEGIKDGNVCI